jgi:hypothetical protein
MLMGEVADLAIAKSFHIYCDKNMWYVNKLVHVAYVIELKPEFSVTQHQISAMLTL